MKAKASAGVVIEVSSGGETFVFQSATRRFWQGALKGKALVVGNLLATNLEWETTAG